ncbi:MAG: ABC transporter ATP-binding protein, partial [Desulfuromonadales bacterium]
MEGLFRAENFSYAYPGREEWTLRDIDLEVGTGQCHCLTGPTGSGKTTLALALKGLLPPGRQKGRLILPAPQGEDRAGVGLVLQNPETQLLTDNLGAEVAFGLENLCLPPGQMPPRVKAALAATGLELPLEHSTSGLSMGQKYRLLIAAQLVMDPALLVLDEPGGQLDPGGLESLAEVIGRLKKEGVAVLLCEHRPGPLAPLIDRYSQLTPSGEILPGCAPEPKVQAPRRGNDPPPGEGTTLVVAAHDLEVDIRDAAPAWEGVSLALQRGQRAVLRGPNGSGKTTLLRCLSGFLRPRKGEVRVFGEAPEPARLRGRVGYLFQNPCRQLFEITVWDEVAFS